MAQKTLTSRIVIRNDTAANWTTNNTKILLKGEIGLETDTGKYKVGDGATNWQNLTYYKHLTDSKATDLDTLISMLNNDEFGKVDDVEVNGASVLNTTTKVASISIGALTISTSGQSVPSGNEGFTGNITLHKIAKTGAYTDLIGAPSVVDNLNSSSTTDALSANQGRVLNSIIQALPTAEAFSNISAMITALNSASSTDYNVGNDLYIIAQNVPDFWISIKETTSSTYTYTTDSAFVNAVETNGYVQVGYYKVSMLETAKVDLTNYVQKTTTIAGIDLQDNITVAELQTALSDATHRFVTDTEKTAWNAKYDKPSGGIPSTDLAESYYLANNPNGYTKVESSNTNGNIKIDNTETTVYTLPNTVLHDTDTFILDGGNSGV